MLDEYRRHINWEGVKGMKDLFKASIVFIPVLWVFNIGIILSCALTLERLYPKVLGYRDVFTPLHVLSGLIAIPIIVLVANSEETFEVPLVNKISSVIIYSLTSLQIYYSFSIHESLKLIWQVRSFKNSNDTEVALLTTFYLAIYNDCCFLADEETPPLDCNSTDFEMPCYEDQELFDLFLDDVSLANTKCVELTGFDPYEGNNILGRSPAGICKRSQRSFFKKIGNLAYRRLWAMIILSLACGFLTLWFSAEYFLFSLGEMFYF